MEKISVPVRIVLVVLVAAAAAGMLAMRTMGPSTETSPEPAALPVQKPAKAQAPAKAPAKPAATARPKQTPAAPAVNAVKPTVPPTGFPKVVDRALGEHDVVVISLVVPGARVDELAAAEAEAGAKLGGAGFLALDVLHEGTARALLTKLDALQDPSVLVVKRSGEIALELSGFVDRETVAQAAANAAP